MAQTAFGQRVAVADHSAARVTPQPRRAREQLALGQELLRPVGHSARAVFDRAAVEPARCVDRVRRARHRLVARLLPPHVVVPSRRRVGGAGLFPQPVVLAVLRMRALRLLVELPDRRTQVRERPTTARDDVEVDQVVAVVSAVDIAGQLARGLRCAEGDHVLDLHAEHRVNDRWRADIGPVLVRMHKGLDRLREDVRSERVAGVEQRRVAHRVPTLERRRATADAGELRGHTDDPETLAHLVLTTWRVRRLQIVLVGHVEPLDRDRAVELLGVARQANEEPGSVRRRYGLAVLLNGRDAAVEVLVLRVVVLLQVEQAVVPHVAVDAALDRTFDERVRLTRILAGRSAGSKGGRHKDQRDGSGEYRAKTHRGAPGRRRSRSAWPSSSGPTFLPAPMTLTATFSAE